MVVYGRWRSRSDARRIKADINTYYRQAVEFTEYSELIGLPER
jgi:hypothetical protein